MRFWITILLLLLSAPLPCWAQPIRGLIDGATGREIPDADLRYRSETGIVKIITVNTNTGEISWGGITNLTVTNFMPQVFSGTNSDGAAVIIPLGNGMDFGGEIRATWPSGAGWTNNYLEGIWFDYCNTTQVCFNVSNGLGSGYCADRWFFNDAAFTSTVTSLGSVSNCIHYCYQTYSSCPAFAPYWSTDAPVYVPTWAGWYDATQPSNRLIDALFTSNSASFSRVFYKAPYANEGKSYGYYWVLLQNGNPSGAYQLLNLLSLSVLPVSVSQIFLRVQGGDIGAQTTIRIATHSGKVEQFMFLSSLGGQYTPLALIWFPMDGSWKVWWYGEDDDDNIFSVYLLGWKLER